MENIAMRIEKIEKNRKIISEIIVPSYESPTLNQIKENIFISRAFIWKVKEYVSVIQMWIKKIRNDDQWSNKNSYYTFALF